MFFSKEFLTGISFACIGVAGLSFIVSRRNNPSTDEYYAEPKNMEEVLEDDTDEFFDAETGSVWSARNEVLNKTTQSKSVEGPYDVDAVEKNAFRDLQHNLKVCEMNCLALKHRMADAIYAVQQTVDEQRSTIDGLKSEMADVKMHLNRLIGTVDQLLANAETTSAERNAEKSEEKRDSCKLGRLKTRISIVEREVTKNSLEIIGLNNTLMLTKLFSGAGAAAAGVTSAGENRFAQCRQPTAPTSGSFTPAAGPPPVHPVPRPPPPPPAVTSADLGPPSPPPPMTTGTPAFRRDLAVNKPCASEVVGAEGKATKTYSRIPITEEILRSVVLKRRT